MMAIANALERMTRAEAARLAGVERQALRDAVVLVEGAWTYRLPARMGEDITRRNEGLPEAIRAAAWKAQVRLCTRYRRLQKTGKPQNVIVVAIAREMAAFVWVIARMAQPTITPA